MIKGYRLMGLYLLCLIALLMWLCSCKQIQYVPVEKTVIEHVYHTDTIKQVDSVKTEKETILREARPEDSVMVAKLGIKLRDNERLLILMQSEFSEKIRELVESHNRDSVRVDSVQVPVPVERKLNKWEQTCLDYGKLMMGGTIVAVIMIVVLAIWWIRRKVIR